MHIPSELVSTNSNLKVHDNYSTTDTNRSLSELSPMIFDIELTHLES